MQLSTSKERLEKNGPGISGGLRGIIQFISKNYLLITLILLIVVGTSLSPRFLVQRNIFNVLLQNSMMAIIALGMLFTIITGGIDLSVGSVVALSGCLAAGFLQGGMNPYVSILAVLGLMALIGATSGVVIAYGKVTPFIATMAMMTIVRGLAYMYQVGSDRRIDGYSFVDMVAGNVGQIPKPVIFMVVIGVLAAFVLYKTTFGRSVYAIGGNEAASRLAGINVKFHVVVVYIISAVLAGFAGLILLGRMRLGTALVGQGYELDAIAAVVIGGASLKGGTGTAAKVLIGAFVIGVLNNVLNLAGVPAYPQMIIKGVIIVAAVIAKKD